MALENGGGMSPADMAAVMNGGNNGSGWGFGNDGGAWWLLILFLFAFVGGNGNWGGYGGGVGGAVPYIGATADIQRGFDQQATSAGIAGLSAQIGNGFADAAVARCEGNANITAAVTGGQYATAQAITGSQYATTQAITAAKDGITGTLTANQIANNQAMNGIAMSLQNCCCENRAGLADLKYTVATENCADRQALSDGLRDLMAQNTANTNAIVQSQNNGFQSVLDKLCQLELDNVKQENERLRTQLNMASLAASQSAQTAQLLQDNNAQTAALIQRIAPPPIPAYPVANPNGCCNMNFGGCGCA